MFLNLTFRVSGMNPKAQGARYGHELNTASPVPLHGTRTERDMRCGAPYCVKVSITGWVPSGAGWNHE